MENTQRIRLTFDVTYALNEVPACELADRLQEVATRALAEGLLTGSTDAEVLSHSIDTSLADTALPAASVEAFLRGLVESGAIDPEDIPVRLVRYGQMDPAAFDEEIRERMGDDDSSPAGQRESADDIPVGESGFLCTLSGEAIIGSYETLNGVADIVSATRSVDGSLEVEHGGGTDVFWNSQKPVIECGERVFVTESGAHVLASEVKLVAEVL